MMNLTRFSSPSQRRQRGFSLVELMVALVLGLLVIGGVGGVFLSQRELYRQNENLARMQENARYAFEVMARSLREVGGNLCGAASNVANKVLGEDIHVYGGKDNSFPKPFGTEKKERVSGTDAVVVWSGTLNKGVVITEHDLNNAKFTVNTTEHGLKDGDIVMACDNYHAAIFKVTEVNSSDVTVHNLSGGLLKFEKGGFISKLADYAWYIGCNGRGGRSLYRLELQNGKDPEEVAEGVSDLQIQYLIAGKTDYVDADDDADNASNVDWTQVLAVRLEFTLHSLDEVAVGKTVNDPCSSQNEKRVLERRWNTVVTLRNHAL
jgi:type IV pilus assembly protein PilW